MTKVENAEIHLNRVGRLTSHLCAAHAQTRNTSSLHDLEHDHEINGIDDNLPYLDSNANELLTPQQRKQYEEDGFFVIKKLVHKAELEKYIQHFIKICSGEEDKKDMLVMRDIVLAKQKKKTDGKLSEEEVTKIQDWQNDEILMKYVRDEKLLKYVRAVIGDNIRSIHTMLINKPPDLGKNTSQHPMHQDLLYFPFRPANKIVAAWTAMQVINEENGCLSVIPGTHKLGLKEHIIPDALNNKAYQGVPLDVVAKILKERRSDNHKPYKQVFLHMEPGDTVFFHPCLIHGSGPNLSSKFRKAISCHYASGDCNMSDIPDHNYGVVDELFEALEKKLNIKAKEVSKKEKLYLYQQIWKLKSRQIMGDESEEWVPNIPKQFQGAN